MDTTNRGHAQWMGFWPWLRSKKTGGLLLSLVALSLSSFPTPTLADPPGWSRGRPPEHARRRPVPAPRPVYRDREDEQASRLVRDASAGIRCEQLSELYRRVAQQVLLTDSRPEGRLDWETSSHYRTDDPRRPPRDGRPPRHGPPRRHPRRDLGPRHWERLWERLGEVVRGCEVDCFEEGSEIGVLSAAGYCSVSVALGGLESPGRIAQPPLPLCGSVAWAGCTTAYRETAQETEGCETYTRGAYENVFEGFLTQDCRMEQSGG